VHVDLLDGREALHHARAHLHDLVLHAAQTARAH
jgi:hypothetical protein